MNKRIFTGLAALAAGVVTVTFVSCGTKSVGSGEEQAEVTTDVAVHVGKITRATLRRYVVAYGTVEPQPATAAQPFASARIATPVAGIISEATCVEGQRVAKGAVLFRLDSRVADVAVERATQALAFAERTFSRQKTLGPGEATSQKAFQEAEQQVIAARNDLSNAQTQRALLTIQAPIAGTITRVGAKPGDAVDLTSVLADVIDLDRLVVGASIRSAEVASLRAGQVVEVSAGEFATGAVGDAPGTARGAVAFIGAQIDPRTDTVTARVSLPAKSGLRPGQFVNMRIICEERRDALAVPAESVVTDADGHSEIALVEGDTAVRRAVTVGLRDGPLVEVSGDNVKEGMTVVTAGAYGLPKQSKIRPIGS
jgi:membrane fusion protein (multidrug efflux system)